MKRAILAVSLFFLVIPASASSIFYDGFNAYLPGELGGQSGGSGWGAAWTAVAANTEIVSPGTALSYSVAGGGTVSGGSSALQLTGNNDGQATRTLGTAQTGDVYFSFLYRQSAGTIDTFDFMTFWFDNNGTTTANQTLIPNIGVRGNQGDGSGPEDFMVRT